MSDAVIEIDDSLRLIGTAHISRSSADLVASTIEEWQPGVVAVELCPSRLASLREPERFDNETLGSVIRSGRAPLLLFQSFLATEQRRLGLESGEKPGVELLAAIEAAERIDAEVELVDRDIQVTLRRAWSKMRIRERIRVLMSLLAPEEDEEVDVDLLVEDRDLLSQMLDELRDLAPGAGSVLIDERDEHIAGRIAELRGEGRVLAVVGAGHLEGVASRLRSGDQMSDNRASELLQLPQPTMTRRLAPWAIPAAMIAVVALLAYRGEWGSLRSTAIDWLLLNSALAALAVLLVRGHPLSVLTAAVASPITSLNPTLAAGWFAGAAQLRFDAPTGRDLTDFLMLDRIGLFWSNRVGRVLLVTVAGNLGSSAGAIIAGSWIVTGILG